VEVPGESQRTPEVVPVEARAVGGGDDAGRWGWIGGRSRGSSMPVLRGNGAIPLTDTRLVDGVKTSASANRSNSCTSGRSCF